MSLPFRILREKASLRFGRSPPVMPDLASLQHYHLPPRSLEAIERHPLVQAVATALQRSEKPTE
jgi:hypothetical protein